MLETVGAGLRPLSTTGIVDAAVEHVRGDPVLYMGIAAPVSFPLAALGLWFVDLVRDYRGEPEGYVPRLVLGGILIALLLHLRFVAQGALAWALERRLRGVEATIGGAWSAALGRGLPLVFAGVLLWGVVAATMIVGFLPAPIVFSLFALAPAACMSEGLGPFATIARSASLGWKEIFRSCAIGAILGLGSLVLGFGSALALSGLLALVHTIFSADVASLETFLSFKNPLFDVGALLFGAALLEPVKALAYALLYVDRRVRTEGFDLKRKVQLILERTSRGALAVLVLAVLLAPTAARAEDLTPRELADRLARARAAAARALKDVDSDLDEDPVLPLAREVKGLRGARVKAGVASIDADPKAAAEVEAIENEPSVAGKRERLARLEKQLAALEGEARRVADFVPPPPPADGTPAVETTPRPGTPSAVDRAREALGKVLDQPRYKKRTETPEIGLSERLDSLLQRFTNWCIRFLDAPPPGTPAWLTTILRFFGALLPATWWGMALLFLAPILLIVLILIIRARRRREKSQTKTGPAPDPVFGATTTQAAPAEAYSEEAWRREARLLAQRGELRAAVRALYNGVLLSLQRSGLIKFEKGRTNWEHVRELRKRDRAMAGRLEPLTRMFDQVWYGKKPVESRAFDTFLAESDAFLGSSPSSEPPR
jgi:hypothetical protein